MGTGDVAERWSVSRLQALRRELAAADLQGLVVPRWDAHQSEYVLPRDERLAWATGFMGSWGLAVVLADTAAIFVDGRYAVQAEREVDRHAFEIRHLYDDPPERWLADRVRAGDRIGFDEMVVPYATYEVLLSAVHSSGAELVALRSDPFEAVWKNRPRGGPGPVLPFPLERAGETPGSKRGRLAEALQAAGMDAIVDSQSDNVGWLLNARAADLPYLPAPQAFVIADAAGGLELFIERDRLPPAGGLDLSGVAIHPPGALLDRVRARAEGGRRIGVDPRFAPAGAALAAQEGGGKPVMVLSPLTALKAVKSETELAGMRAACRRDAVAWVRFLSWIEAEVLARSEQARPPLVEIEAEKAVLAFRRELEGFVGPSFRSISASGANAASCHYAAPSDGGSPITADELYLLDSGGHYLDGTTDLTRTVCFARPDEDLRRAFTLVLKGHVTLARQRFPADTCGYQLDALARIALWSEHLDYDHGTGHGVGHFLSVHEHPQRIGKEALRVPLKPGMIVTIEPGHYLAGRYGIRIENMYEVIGEPGGWMRFEPITFVPICLDLVDGELLDPAETAWLDAYHQRTRTEFERAPLSADDRRWLLEAARELSPHR